MAVSVCIQASPYNGNVDFVRLDLASSHAEIDAISIADVLRNAFVYPPYSAFRDVKLATYGFHAEEGGDGTPVFRSPLLENSSVNEEDDDWVNTYHQLLSASVNDSCKKMQAPWMLQSGGKDSTSIAIAAADVRPDITCLTYLGGIEEDETESASQVCRKLGLRHEVLVCDPVRAYSRYQSLVDRMPLLTGDFALLSYADLATEIAHAGGDGIVDGLGSDIYFGTPVGRQQKVLNILARGVSLPSWVSRMPFIRHNFKLSYVLGTFQMRAYERFFPGSRFTDQEVDELLGGSVSVESRRRLETFKAAMKSCSNVDAQRLLSVLIEEAAAALQKGLSVSHALDLQISYPYCNESLRQWVMFKLPPHLRVKGNLNKVIVRQHIASRFPELPYVDGGKGSFRFDLCRFATLCFDEVFSMAISESAIVPGATRWLDRHRHLLGNKYHASKFYLLAVTLPWLKSHLH